MSTVLTNVLLLGRPGPEVELGEKTGGVGQPSEEHREASDDGHVIVVPAMTQVFNQRDDPGDEEASTHQRVDEDAQNAHADLALLDGGAA